MVIMIILAILGFAITIIGFIRSGVVLNKILL